MKGQDDGPVLRLDEETFDAGLMCHLERLEYDTKAKIGALWLADGSCTDMGGAIAVFERIDPGVQAIMTFAGRRRDTAYHRTSDGSWRAVVGSTIREATDAPAP